MLHTSGNYNNALGGAEVISGSPTPIGPSWVAAPSSATFVSPLQMNSGTVPPPTASSRAAMAEQVLAIKASLVNVVRDDLIDKVGDETVQRLLKLADQLEAVAALKTGISIAIPTLNVPAAKALPDSPSVAPVSAHSRIKSMDLNDIPTFGVESTNYQTSGEVSPVATALPKRSKSVVFFQHDYNLEMSGRPSGGGGGGMLGENPFDDEGHRFVARSYSGFGSFRRASRHASMAGGELGELKQRMLSFKGDGMPTLDLGGDDGGGMRARFSRPISRHTEVFAADPSPFIDECATASTDALLEINVDDNDTNLLAIDAEEAIILKSVAIRVFAQYEFMRVGAVDINAFLSFIDAISRYNNVTNPYRNGHHTAETLMGVHQYLRQQDVANHFTDDEITSVLIAALFVNLGYLGVSNEFLLQLNHPLSRVFSIVNTSESVSTMIGLQLLERYNFLAPSCSTKDVFWLGLQEGVADLLSSSSAREHQSQLKQVVGMTERGYVGDAEVPLLLSCVLRAATMRFCCKPRPQHIRYAELWVNEAYKQSECERIMGFREGAQQWTNDTAWASVQAFVTIVCVPYFEALQEFFPEEWADNLKAVTALYGSLQSPVANATASFRDGAAALSITVDPNVPEWSDQSSLTLNVLTSIIPQHLVMGRVGTASRSRMDHYYSFLQLYDTCEKDVLRAGSFGGSLVQLAMQLDPLYIGEYASALIDDDDFTTYADAAALIMTTEVTPDTSTVMSPARKLHQQSSDAFIVLLLRMFHERVGPAAMSGPSSLGASNASGSAAIIAGIGGGSVSASVGSVGGTTMLERSAIGAQGGPFRGKWRLTASNSVYEGNGRGRQ